ncbi:hypothetical protein DV738_g867, partial [Chaetothyriales sp. CBS 135597]
MGAAHLATFKMTGKQSGESLSLHNVESALSKDTCVKLAGLDVDGMCPCFAVCARASRLLRGKLVSKKKFLSVVKDGFGFCSVIFGWDMHDLTYFRELKISNKDNGYRDLIAKIDLASYRRIPWENNLPFFLVSFHDPDTQQPICACPRSLLRTTLAKVHDAGYGALAGAEYEFFTFRAPKDGSIQTSQPSSSTTAPFLQNNPVSALPHLTQGMFGYSLTDPIHNQDWFYSIFDVCEKFNCNIEGWHTESGPGVFEAALEYGEIAEMADRASLFKWVVKAMGSKHGITPCFMAKPKEGLPGNSGHIHCSLVDRAGRNLFYRGEKDPNPPFKDVEYVSDLGRSFLAGLLDGLADVMPIIAPTINSYKRLVENFWAPITVSWGLEHRAASIRLVAPPTSPPKGTRFEIRVCGADANPALVLATILALGWRGVEQKLELTLPPLSKGAEVGSAEDKGERLPKSLRESTARFMAKDSVARQIFGDDFVEHFGGTREHELRLWDQAVTDWEVRRYIETVSQKRRYASVELVDEVINLWQDAYKTRYKATQVGAEINSVQKEIGKLKKAKQDASELLQKKIELEKEKKRIEDEAVEKEKLRDKKCKTIGNYVEKNAALSHHEVMTRADIYDGERGTKLVGHRGYFLRRWGVLLNQALINYGLHFLYSRGYDPIQPPFFMKAEYMAKTAQLEDFDEALYKVVEDKDSEEKYLIATSEQPLSSMFADEWMAPADLPLKFAGYSSCFRKEAGAHGRDAWGLYRVHQFEKIEQFIFTKPEDSWEALESMRTTAEEFYQSLKLPYRVVVIVSGALNNAAAKKYDLEAWFPYQGEYKELVSCSNCTDYQTRELEIRYGQKKGAIDSRKTYCHALNGTLCATERTLCCIVENYQTEEGIRVPDVLKPYMPPGTPDVIPYTKDLPKDAATQKTKKEKPSATPASAASTPAPATPSTAAPKVPAPDAEAVANKLADAKLLARDLNRPVYTVDLRNHGDSPHHPEHTYTAMARDVEALISSLAIPPPLLIGHSMGAKSSFATYVNAMREIAEAPASVVRRQSDADDILAKYEPDVGIRQFLLTNLAFKWRIPLTTLAKALPGLGDFPFRDPAVARYSGPTLVVRGIKSPYVSDESLPVIGAFFPSFELVDVDCGHWVTSEKPEQFRAAVVDWVKRKVDGDADGE